MEKSIVSGWVGWQVGGTRIDVYRGVYGRRRRVYVHEHKLHTLRDRPSAQKSFMLRRSRTHWHPYHRDTTTVDGRYVGFTLMGAVDMWVSCRGGVGCASSRLCTRD